jgi:hypothetical protein
MTGELLLAQVDLTNKYNDSISVELHDPIAYMVAADEHGRQSLRPVPWVAKRCWLYFHAVAAEIEEDMIQQELKDHYRQATGGLMIAKTMPTIRSN